MRKTDPAHDGHCPHVVSHPPGEEGGRVLYTPYAPRVCDAGLSMKDTSINVLAAPVRHTRAQPHHIRLPRHCRPAHPAAQKRSRASQWSGKLRSERLSSGRQCHCRIWSALGHTGHGTGFDDCVEFESDPLARKTAPVNEMRLKRANPGRGYATKPVKKSCSCRNSLSIRRCSSTRLTRCQSLQGSTWNSSSEPTYCHYIAVPELLRMMPKSTGILPN